MTTTDAQAIAGTEELERTVSIDGMELHYRVRGRGQPLLLLHGFSGSGDDWQHAFDLDQLARHHRLIVPDARGHGRSTNPLPSFSHRQCARDVAALLDHLDLARVRAVGASLGANTLLHLATRQPARVEAMVLVSGTMYLPAQARAVMRAIDLDRLNTPEQQPLRTLWSHARAWADDHEDLSFTPPLLATITARTLVVYGDRDHLYPVEMAVEMYRAIPTCSLLVIPGGGHGPIYEGDGREMFRRAALTFLGSGGP